jgi:hypothetical protein
MLAGCQTSKNA